MKVKNTKVNFNLFFTKEGEVVFYPYEAVSFTTTPLIDFNRDDCDEIEKWFYRHASKRYDTSTKKYIFVDEIYCKSNKSTFTYKGMAYHFHDSELWIYPESSMEIGRF